MDDNDWFFDTFNKVIVTPQKVVSGLPYLAMRSARPAGWFFVHNVIWHVTLEKQMDIGFRPIAYRSGAVWGWKRDTAWTKAYKAQEAAVKELAEKFNIDPSEL